MEHLINFAYFMGETLIILIAIIIAMGFLFHFLQRGKTRKNIEIENLGEHFRTMTQALQIQAWSKKEIKSQQKSEKKKQKEREKQKADSEPHVFVVDFIGDMKATACDSLREEITTIIGCAKPDDEVLVRLESAGGLVNGYGLAASQLARLREKQIPLTVAIDKMAASGGYMMACVADRIIAAPFAVVGSIGVVAPVPNFNRVLKKHDIDYREYTAGDYKRTVSMLGEITPQGIAKFNEQLQDTHVLFKGFVHQYRPSLDIDKIATGEHWFGSKALELGLIDTIKTSDTYLLEKSERAKILKVSYLTKKKLSEKLAGAVARLASSALASVQNEILKSSVEK